MTIVNEAVGIINAQSISLRQQIQNFVELEARNSTVIPENCSLIRCDVLVNDLPILTQNKSLKDANLLRGKTVSRADCGSDC